MEKETILAKIRATMSFSEETLEWLEGLPRIDGVEVWFKREGGTLFFSEFRRNWEEILVDSSEPLVQEYFRELGIPENKLPRIRVYESYSGSWIIDAAIVMAGSMGSVYAVLKAVSELPKIADGLTELKDRLKRTFSKKANKAVHEHLKSQSTRYHFPPPPTNPLSTDFVIDARPLLSLTPSIMKSHKIHLNAAISRDSFSLENLSDDIMRDIRIGIFKSKTPRHEWKYYESYMGKIDILSPHQTITKDISDFKNSKGEPLDLSDNTPLHVDCWVQDSHGIYLFMFYLEE